MFTGIVQQVGTVTQITDRPNARSYWMQLPLGYVWGLKLGASVANNGCCLTAVEVKYVVDGLDVGGQAVAQGANWELFANPDVQENDAVFINHGSPTAVTKAVLGKLATNPELANVTDAANYALVRFDLISTTLDLTNLGKLEVGAKVNIERSYRVGDEVGGHILSGHVDATVEIVKVVNQDNIYQVEFALPERFKEYVLDKGFVGLDGMSLTVSSITPTGFTVNLIPETLEKTTIGTKGVGDLVNFEVDNSTKTIVNTVKAYLAQQAK